MVVSVIYILSNANNESMIYVCGPGSTIISMMDGWDEWPSLCAS
jgi:hypothetical protein